MNKLVKVNRSYKYEGFLMVVLPDGKQYKRRFREYLKGQFKGKVTFNMWDNVYSFRCSPSWSEVLDEDITFEGRYEEVYGKKNIVEKIKGEVENQNVPKEAHENKPVAKVPQGEVKHVKYNQIKACVDMSIPIYLVGPAGSGKNFTLEQIAKDLDMNFYFSNSIQQEYKLTGFIDAGGEYHETEFYKACKDEKDCIFFLDEMDASIPEVLVLLNAAIANGYFEFPTGKVELKHVRFVAAGNTVGNGADEQYTGRLVLDQATLDRFAIIDFDYDLNIEIALSKGNVELVNFIRQLRQEAKSKGVRATFSYRCITMVTKLESALGMDDIVRIAVMKGFDNDTVRTFNPSGSSRYHTALRNLQRAA